MRALIVFGVAGVLGMVACGSDSAGGSSGGSSGSSGSSGGSSGSSGSSGGSSGSSGSSGGSSSGSSGGVAGPGTMYAGCRIFPNDNPWNTDISGAALDAALMTSIMPKMALGTGLHPDWGTVSDQYGIPITSGPEATPVTVSFHTSYGPGESDKLACPSGGGQYCYPIPLTASIEGGTGSKTGSDRHVLFVGTNGAPDHCTLYELYNAQNPSGGWDVSSSAIFKLDTNALRPEGWTSADAAGLPVMAGLVRYDEVKAGAITHAIRFTMDASQNGYIHPATHEAGDVDASLPPMGLRLRLKAGFDDSKFAASSKVITTAMKKYGVILADNGSNWYISGESNEGWAAEMDALLKDLGKVTGGDFEIVKTGDIVIVPPG
jgi:hypothetical protein